MDGEDKARGEREYIASLLFDGIRDLIRNLEAKHDVEIHLVESFLVSIDDDWIYDEPQYDHAS